MFRTTASPRGEISFPNLITAEHVTPKWPGQTSRSSLRSICNRSPRGGRYLSCRRKGYVSGGGGRVFSNRRGYRAGRAFLPPQSTYVTNTTDSRLDCGRAAERHTEPPIASSGKRRQLCAPGLAQHYYEVMPARFASQKYLICASQRDVFARAYKATCIYYFQRPRGV